MVLVSLILLTFSILILSPVNSWFTSGSGLKLKFEIAVGDIMVTVKQKISEDKTLILYEGGEYPDKIDISSSNGVKEILPDTEYGLELEMSNADIGVGKVKLKFKAQFYAIGMNEDILLDSSLIGYQAPSESEAGFVRNSADDNFYHYVDSDGNDAEFDSNAVVTLMTGFKINYDETYAQLNCEIIKMVLTIITYQ